MSEKIVGKLRIAQDLDGVLANLNSVILAEWSLKVGRQLRLSDVRKWDWLSDFNVSSADQIETYVNVWSRYDWKDIEPYERNLAELTRAIRSGITWRGDSFTYRPIGRYDIVTAHTEAQRPNIEAWLKGNGVVYDSLVLTGTSPTSSEKVTAYKGDADKQKLEYDVYIDDRSKTIRDAVARGKTGILFLQPWNESDIIEGAYRVRSLAEIPEMLARAA